MHSFAYYFRFSLIVLTTFKGCRYFKGVENVVVAENRSLLSSQFDVNVHGNSNETNLAKDMQPISATKGNEFTVKSKLEKDPFQQWKYKSTWSQLSDLEVNSELMSKAIQLGDPIRLKKVLLKALTGQQINLVVIGGSNSAGGKLGVDERSLDGLFFKVFANWWNNTLGKATKAFIKEYQVTIGGTGSYVFAYCYKTFIPEDLKIDIVLIEASINFNTRGKAEALEQLTRQVLADPSAPAVLYINLVSGVGLDPATKKVINPSCINLENFGQTELARHYGITSFSLKEVLCRKENNGWKASVTNLAGSDGRHVGVKVHAQAAMMIIEYVRGVFKDVLNGFPNGANAKEITPSALPELLFLKRKTEALREPLCWTGITPDISKCCPRSTLPVEVIERKGFSPKGGMREGQADENNRTDLRTDEQGGWSAWNNGCILKLRIQVPPLKSQSPSSRSLTIVTRTSGSGGKAKVWLDNDEEKAIYINSKSNFGNNPLNTVATRVEPGYHVVTVKTLRWGMFLISGLLVGPPDFDRRQVL